MIRETGRVVAVERDAVWVETLRRSTCQSCSLQKGCGHGLMETVGAGRRQHIRVLPGSFHSSDFSIDDEVEISIPERVLVGGALLLYLVPLLSLLAGAIAGALWVRSEPALADRFAALGAAIGLGVGLLLVRLHSYLGRNRSGLQPVIAGFVTHTGAGAVPYRPL